MANWNTNRGGDIALGIKVEDVNTSTALESVDLNLTYQNEMLKEAFSSDLEKEEINDDN